MKALFSDPVFTMLLVAVLWPIVGGVVTYLCRGFAKSDYPIVRRLFAGFSATTFDAPKLGRAISSVRPPEPSIIDPAEVSPPTPRGPLGVARVAAMALGSVLGVLSMVLLSGAAHVAGCAWLQAREPAEVVHVIHEVDGACDVAERAPVDLPGQAKTACAIADALDELADRVEAHESARQVVQLERADGSIVRVPAEPVAEQAPKRKRKRGPRRVDGGTP